MNTNIYLCNVKMLNDYNNTLIFKTKEEQDDYFNSIIKKTFNDYYYLRENNFVILDMKYDEAIKYNYLIYINTDYSNKKWYNFITKIEYVNETSCRVFFETDVIQTFMFEINFNQVFIERETVDNDTVGLHTVPEDLETGEYISNEHIKDSNMNEYNKDLKIVMASDTNPLFGEEITRGEAMTGSGIYNGIYTGLHYFQYDLTSSMQPILEGYATKGWLDAIIGFFVAPEWLATKDDGNPFRGIKQSREPNSYNLSIDKQYTLNGYNPKNNKLKCFPYNYLLLSNNAGQNAILHYEKSSTNKMEFVVRGVLNIGCSINITPLNYDGNAESNINSISLSKFPTCSFQGDAYTNWLTQNSLNILGSNLSTDDISVGMSAITTIGGIVAGVLTKNAGAVGSSVLSGFQSISGAVTQKKQHNMIAPSCVGQLNDGDINTASSNNTFHFYKMSIKSEYARIIDNYFSMYGYKINRVKTPNLFSRKNWNFIKTIGANFTGDIPQMFLNQINNIFNNGITLWHDKNTMLDYSQNNDII